jgi:hypothetical protein
VVLGGFCQHVPWTAAVTVVLERESGERLTGVPTHLDLRYVHPHPLVTVDPDQTLQGNIYLSRLFASYGWDEVALKKEIREGKVRAWVTRTVTSSDSAEAYQLRSREIIL